MIPMSQHHAFLSHSAVGAGLAGGVAPSHATAGKLDSLMHDFNLESLKLNEDARVPSSDVSSDAGRSKPLDMPSGRKGSRRTRTGSNLSSASDSRKRHPSGDDVAGKSYGMSSICFSPPTV